MTCGDGPGMSSSEPSASWPDGVARSSLVALAMRGGGEAGVARGNDGLQATGLRMSDGMMPVGAEGEVNAASGAAWCANIARLCILRMVAGCVIRCCSTRAGGAGCFAERTPVPAS